MHSMLGMRRPIEVESMVDIDAPPEAVWRVLTDFERFRAWNPFIVKASGDVRLGGVVHLTVRAFPSSPMRISFVATITVCDRARELRWRGDFGAPWIGAGDHVFSLAPRGPGRTCFLQRETFSGLLPRVVRPALALTARRGFERMNEALAAQCLRERATAIHTDGAPS